MTTPTTNDQQPATNSHVVPAEKLFTQSELNSIISDRLAREAGKFADYGDLKGKAEQWDSYQTAQSAQADQRVNVRVTNAEAKVVAAQANFHNPNLAVRLVAEELRGVKVGDDGEPDVEAIKVIVDKLAEDNPYLLKTATDGSVVVKVRNPKPNPAQGATPPDKPTGGTAGLAEAKRRGWVKD